MTRTISEQHFNHLQTTKIITSHVWPPIPIRKFDWCAYLDGREEDTSMYGWGETEEDARLDLQRLIADEEEI